MVAVNVIISTIDAGLLCLSPYPDVSLPAILMPTKLGHVYSPRAHCYFHPTGYDRVYTIFTYHESFEVDKFCNQQLYIL